MTNIKPVKVLVITEGYKYRRGILVGREGEHLYRIKLLEGPPESYRGQPIFITEITVYATDFIIIEGLGEVLYE